MNGLVLAKIVIYVESTLQVFQPTISQLVVILRKVGDTL